jgi:hypothetical protein
MTKARPTADVGYLWLAKGRENYIKVCKNMGIYDICECDGHPGTRIRPNSGHPGMLECRECGGLKHPLSHLYHCDECTEPFLPDQYALGLNERALCLYC